MDRGGSATDYPSLHYFRIFRSLLLVFRSRRRRRLQQLVQLVKQAAAFEDFLGEDVVLQIAADHAGGVDNKYPRDIESARFSWRPVDVGGRDLATIEQDRQGDF